MRIVDRSYLGPMIAGSAGGTSIAGEGIRTDRAVNGASTDVVLHVVLQPARRDAYFESVRSTAREADSATSTSELASL